MVSFPSILREAWEKSRGQGLLWFLLVLASAFPHLVSYGFLQVGFSSLPDGRPPALSPSLVSLLVTILFLGLVAAPAYGSGLMALFRQVHEGERPSLETFMREAGTYYWRIAGGGLLFALLVFFLGGFLVAGGPAAGVLRALFLPFLVFIRMVALYWSPAVALGDRTVLGGIQASTRMALLHWLPTLLLVLVDVGLAEGFSSLSGAGGMASGLGSDAEGWLQRPSFLRVAAVILLQGSWQLYFRMVVWTFFRRGAPALQA
ncbi:MAG: hypothetical protein KM310_02290 [Clostridiales bacterium]|nr:hypothetical protein [Clostridiales bacterium]